MEVTCPTFGLPANTFILQHQIAGHCHGEGKTKLGMLKHESGDILKPCITNDIRSVRELKFYQEIFNLQCTNSFLLELKNFIPQYHGLWETDYKKSRVQYIRLEDITTSFRKPSIIDIKIGAQTYDPLASQDKIDRERAKFPFLQEIAFKISGMRVYQNEKNDYLVYGKQFGKEITPETQVQALHLYFDNQTGLLIKSLLNKFISQLEDIENWFQRQTDLSFYSSSLLLVYEGSSNNYELGDNFQSFDKTSVRMIDFAHVFPGTGKDENYIRGLRSLIGYFKKLLQFV